MTYQSHEKTLAAARAGLTVARHGNQRWAVISTGDDPMVIYWGLDRKEAAEIALEMVAVQMADNGNFYGPSEIPDCYFEGAGWVLKCLREAGVERDDLKDLAFRIADGPRGKTTDCEIPF
jgi:hypothetical protein